jgi:hypothetical protein
MSGLRGEEYLTKMQRFASAVGALFITLITLMGGCSSGEGQTISGLVTAMDQSPLAGVHVSAYGKSTTTDAAGRFSLATTPPPDRVVVNFQKDGYFDQIIGKKPSPNGTNLKLAMLRKDLVGTVDNSTGGKVGTADISGDFPADSFVRQDGSGLAGGVDIYAAYLNPDSPGFGEAMPGGDFSAKESGGADGQLKSFGALAIEGQEKSSGDKATLKKPAGLCVAIPPKMLANAPATMPVWFLNNGGVWEQRGTATKVNNTYCFSVSELGKINCDVFSRTTLLTGKVCDATKPLPRTPVPDVTLSVGQPSTQTDKKGEYAVLVQSGVMLTLTSPFGSTTGGPFTAGGTSVLDVGCTDVAVVGCPDAVKDIKASLPYFPANKACDKACAVTMIDCYEKTPCDKVQPCMDASNACTAKCP